MPGLTKKKKKVSSGPVRLEKPKAKVSTRVKNFASKHEKDLKKLGWVLGATNPATMVPTAGLAALTALKKRRGKGRRKVTTGKGR
jgi:hypothetical protein|tara:strand:+ start:93 stop:347 length:255 start_codon:yes stop_codon:yes gene_type:complete